MRFANNLCPFLVLFCLTSFAYCEDPAPLPTADELLVKMEAAVAKLNSYQADMQSGTETNHMVFERSENGGKTVERIFVTQKRSANRPDGTDRIQEFKEVNDGTFFWEEYRTSDQPGISVRKYDSKSRRARSSTTLKNVTTSYLANALGDRDIDIRVVGEETVEGRKMYVLEASYSLRGLRDRRMKDMKTKLWIGQDDLMVYRQVSTSQRTDQDQPTVSITQFLNVKLNEKIDPNLFKYTPPEGAKVIDKTDG